jgi:hypothetical protein
LVQLHLNYTLNPGRLILGSTVLNYGGGANWNGGNAAGLLMACDNNIEIVVHDNGKRLASLMYYEGDTIIKIIIGRDMGWGALSSVVVNGNVSIGTSTQNALLTLYGTTQLQPKIALTGIEYYSGTNANGDGIGLF